MKTNSIFSFNFSVFLIFAVCLLVFPNFEKVKAVEPTESEVFEKERTAEDLSKNWSGESYRRSIALYLETSAERLKLGDSVKAAENLRQAAELFFQLADSESSKRYLYKAIEIDEKNKNNAGLAKSYAFLSLIFTEEGNRSESDFFYKKAVEAGNYSGDYEAQASAFLSQAENGYYHADIDSAVSLYEKALNYGEKANNTKLLARILLNLSYAYSKQGKSYKALESAQNSLQKWREIGDKRGQATTYTALGLAYKMLNQEHNALNAYYNAESLFPADTDLIEKARLFTGIASIYGKYNETDLTKNYLQKAYDLFGEAEYPLGQLTLLPDLIKVNYLTNNNETAEKYYDEVKSLSKDLDYEIYLAYTGEILGNKKVSEGLFDDAVKEYASALAIFQKLKNKKGSALIYQRLGEVLAKQGKFSGAAENFNKAMSVNREIKDGFSESENLFQLAKLNHLQKNDNDALELVKSAIELTERLYSDTPNTKLKTSFFSSSFERFELLINLLMKMHGKTADRRFADEALKAAERSRARIMLETLSLTEADFTKDAEPGLINLENEIRSLLNLKSDKVTDLLSRSAPPDEIEKLYIEISDLQNQLEQIKAELKKNSPVYSAVKNPAPFDLVEFQEKVLDENSLFLEFSFGAENSFLWLVGKNEFEVYTLPPRERLEAQIGSLREILDSRKIKPGEEIAEYQTRTAQADLEYWRKAHLLSDELFGQIAEKISGKRLVIAADGKLRYFPVSALPLPNSEKDEPLLLTNETVYEPSGQTLLFLAKQKSRNLISTKDLVVFSDPVFSFDDPRISANRNSDVISQTADPSANLRFAESLNDLPRLDASGEESKMISSIFHRYDVFSGFSANRSNALNEKISDYKIIHFATHGLVNEERPELSGIVLSGFDPNGQKIEQLIRLQDIYGLNLNADLVVLSACETGIGKEVKGEGLLSLSNAFLSVGAKSVMSSLWKVEDGATLELMKNFYDAMASERITPSQALQKAQIKMRQNPRYKSPFYWAAFTVQGDYLNVPEVSNGYRLREYLLPLAAAITLLGICGWLAFTRRRNRM